MVSITTIMLLQWLLNRITRTIIRTLLRMTYPILDLLLHFTLYIIISTCYVTQYPINNVSMMVLCKISCLISPTDAEIMGRLRHKREKYSPPCLEALPKEKLILTHYMLTECCIKHLYVLGH